MKLITQTEFLGKRYGEKEAVKMICEAGFDAIDYSMFAMKDEPDYVLNQPGYKNHLKELRDIASSYGVTFDQAHSPFPPMRVGDVEYSSMMWPKILRSIECAGLLGVEIIVVHPIYTPKNCFETNMEMFHSLEYYAKESGVKIALENMWGTDKNGKKFPNVCSTAEDFNRYVDALNPDVFTACLDLGHIGLVGENAPEMIKKMGSRIACLHVHDNNGIDDSHTLPYTMSMDFKEILTALAQIDYKGNLTFEADHFFGRIPYECVESGLKFMEEIGRAMIRRFEIYKNGND